MFAPPCVPQIALWGQVGTACSPRHPLHLNCAHRAGAQRHCGTVGGPCTVRTVKPAFLGQLLHASGSKHPPHAGTLPSLWAWTPATLQSRCCPDLAERPRTRVTCCPCPQARLSHPRAQRESGLFPISSQLRAKHPNNWMGRRQKKSVSVPASPSPTSRPCPPRPSNLPQCWLCRHAS